MGEEDDASRSDRGTAKASCHPNFGGLFTTTIPSEEVESRLFDGVIGLPVNQFDVIELGEVVNVEVSSSIRKHKRSVS